MNCPTCGKLAHSPYRSHNAAGVIVQGCIDDFHTEALSGMIHASTHWHFRAEAKKHRAAVKRHLRELTRRA